MPIVTLSIQDVLRPKFIEGIINAEAEQQLDFKDIFPTINTSALAFSYMEDLTTAGDDIASGVQGKPLDMGELSQLTEIEVSPISMKHGALERFGYSIKFSKRSLREEAFVDELLRAYQRAAFGIAKKINDDIYNAVIGTTNDITEVSGSAVWSADTADPVGDLVLFKEAMDLEGFPYDLTDLYVHKTNYYEFQKYMLQIDRAWGLNPRNEFELPPVLGVRLHNTHSTQQAEGSYLGFDRRYPAATIYKYVDPDFSSNPVDNRIMVFRYDEEKYPHNIVIELISEMGIAVKVPNAFTYKSSGI